MNWPTLTVDPLSQHQVEFATINRFPGYCFGSDGTVWSSWSNGGYVIDRWKLLKTDTIKGGYLRVRLRAETQKYVRIQVSHLILESFVGCNPGGLCACHGDGNPANNSRSNLRWGTRRENEEDKKLHGTHQTGERNPAAKLTTIDIREIRRIRSDELASTYEIARRFGISRPVVCKIIKNKLWRSVT